MNRLTAAFAVVLAGCGTVDPRDTDPTIGAPATITVPATAVPVVQLELPAVAAMTETFDAATTAVATATAVRIDPPEPTTTVDYDALVDAEYAGHHCNQWAGEALAAGWPRDQLPKMLFIMFLESRCQPEVRSTTSDSGLLQINDIVLRDWRFRRDWPGFDPATLFDPNVNLTVAVWLWHIDGWQPWAR